MRTTKHFNLSKPDAASIGLQRVHTELQYTKICDNKYRTVKGLQEDGD